MKLNKLDCDIHDTYCWLYFTEGLVLNNLWSNAVILKGKWNHKYWRHSNIKTMLKYK